MILFHKPTDAEVAEFLNGQRALDFTYAEVGATSSTPPTGFVIDHYRELLGHGEDLFNAAKSQLSAWTPFDLGWITARPKGVPLEAGETIAVVIHRFGVHWMNACRIVAVIDAESPRRFGFIYGTLPGHAECGEERFLLEMDEAGDVWFDILAFSRPRHWLAKLGYPVVRRLQKSFAPVAVKRLQKSLLPKPSFG